MPLDIPFLKGVQVCLVRDIHFTNDHFHFIFQINIDILRDARFNKKAFCSRTTYHRVNPHKFPIKTPLLLTTLEEQQDP